MQVTRRKLVGTALATAAKGVGLGAAIGAGHALLTPRRATYPVGSSSSGSGGDRPGARLIRPPGAVDEPAFLAGCIRCTRCQDACDPGSIQFFTEVDGERFHTPYVDPAIRGCTLCMKCTQVCPSGVLAPLEFEDRASVDMATVELRIDLCLSYKAERIRDEQALLRRLGRERAEAVAPDERRGPCGECYTFCPLRKHAIRLKPGAFLAPLVFADACVGCGMCEEICRVVVRGEPAIRVVPTRKTV